MSTDNKSARQALEQIYGKGCMFKKSGAEQQIEQLRTIKTYKMFLSETRYTGKKIHLLEKNMTYHHLKHRSEGGKANIENGAIVNELAHRYIHSLPREQEEIVNNMLRKYKLGIKGGTLQVTNNGIHMEDPFDAQLEFDLANCITIPVYDNDEKTQQKREKYNRAKSKRELQEEVDVAMTGKYRKRRFDFRDDER